MTKLAGIILSFATLTLTGCHQRPTVERTRDQGAGGQHPTGALVAAPGVVEPWGGEVRLSSAEPGLLVELRVAERDLVVRDQLLARLEDSAQLLAVRSAEAELRQAEAQLGGVESTPEDVAAAEADAEAARVRAALAAGEGERRAALGVGGVISASDVERARADSEAAAASLAAARARLATIKRGMRASERTALRARVELAGTRLEAARAALERRMVRAPSDGVVLWSRFHPGEFYSPGAGPLIVLGDGGRLQARLEVNDLDAAAVQPGARCQLRADTGEPLGEGTVVRAAPEFGSRSIATERPTGRSDGRVLEVFVEVEAGSPLRPGQRVWGYVNREPGATPAH